MRAHGFGVAIASAWMPQATVPQPAKDGSLYKGHFPLQKGGYSCY